MVKHLNRDIQVWYQSLRVWLLPGALVSCMLAACQVGNEVAADPAVAEIELASTIPCHAICECPAGYNTCTGSPSEAGICSSQVFGPLPSPLPGPFCASTCQCNGGVGCVGGYCVPATMTASPNPVIIPAGQTTATFTLTWNAPDYIQVDLLGVQNLEHPGQVLFLGSGPSAGTALEPMSVGEVATLWLYNHGDRTTPIATLHIAGRH
jgi:hypothetical protein